MLINILLIVLILLILCSIITTMRSKYINGKVYDFLDRKCTNSLKGFAIIMVMFAHVCQYEATFKEIIFGGNIMSRILFSWGAVGVAIFFILSGYGCFISISKTESLNKWFVKHLLKLYFTFIVAYIVVIFVRCSIFGIEISVKDIVTNFLLLKLPECSTWYFKIQLLFYLLIVIAKKISSRYVSILTAVFTFLYVCIAYKFGLPEYWWKTSMCFTAGCFIAQYKDVVKAFADKWFGKALITISAVVAYLVILRHSRFPIVLQLPAYVILAVFIVLVWDFAIHNNKVLLYISKFSFAAYLVHIGIVDCTYLLDSNVNIKTIIFISITVIGTVISWKISDMWYNKVNS